MEYDPRPKAILRELPRRSPLTVRRVDTMPPAARRLPVSPRANGFQIAYRGVRWGVAVLALLVRIARDRLRGKVDARQWGTRMRQLFQEMGGAAVKIGQQLSVRIDLFPYALCRELEQLVDSIPPFPAEQAIDIIERSMGERHNVDRVPLDQIFQTFDPNPIGSASIACVFQAILPTGENVAVKVQRPGIECSIASDLGVIDFVTQMLEALTVVRSGFFKNLRQELRTMLGEELDFGMEARYTRLFRYYAKRDKMKWVTAPKVYTKYCWTRMLVTSFESGFWCTEILAAKENNDQAALAVLAEKGITPKKVGRRLMEYSFWSRYEALFFHADPHHGNIIVKEDSKLILIDFGSCGTTSRKSRLAQLMIMDRMRHNDVSGTVEAAVSTLEPLPMLDVYGLKKGIETDFWGWLLAFRDKKSEWWERTTAGLWLGLLKETRERHIPVGLETLRLARSLLLIDTLCFRLDPKMVSPDAFVKYERKAMARGAKRAMKNARRPLSQHINTIVKEGDDLLSRARYIAWQAERLMDSFPNEFAGTVSKISTFAGEALRAIILATVAGAGVFFYVWYTGSSAPGAEWSVARTIIRNVIRSPWQLGILLTLAVMFYRRVAFRVNDLDVDRRGGGNR
jgi:predicted unusual protein kinase regulating ubiquinone biosynthesis (AarF/ABC1/UbiB family)